MQQIIAVTNQKGGVGKTTTTISLASYLADMGQRVLVVDLDPQANTTSGLGINKNDLNHSVYQALFDENLFANSIVQNQHGVALVPSTPELAAAEVELASELAREHRLKNLLARAAFDYIIIDCPPSLGLLTVNALNAANHVIIPVQAEYYALEGLSQLINTISRVKQALNPALNLLGVVLTMYDSRTSLSPQVLGEVKQHFPKQLFKTVIPRNIRLAEAPSFGRPINKHDKWSKGARSYKKLAKEVHNRVQLG